MTWVLGIAGSHNGGACLLKNGRVYTAIQEERLTGVKRDRVFGSKNALSIQYCLDCAGITLDEVSLVVLANQDTATRDLNDIRLNPLFKDTSPQKRMLVSHHLAHAASVFASSGFRDAAILVCDGVGSPLTDTEVTERTRLFGPKTGSEHLSLFQADGTGVIPLEVHSTECWYKRNEDAMPYFGSLGGMFSAAAHQIFGDAQDAGKVMGLAPYGEPVYPPDEFFKITDKGIRFPSLIQRRFSKVGLWPEKQIENSNLASSTQHALTIAISHFVKKLRGLSSSDNLCLAGGVALNSVTNDSIYRNGLFKNVFVIPAADDSGTAIGAAYLGWWEVSGDHRTEKTSTDYFGKTYDQDSLELSLQRVPNLATHQPKDLFASVAKRLADGEVCAWFQGGSEFGPRALGNRSILASPCLSSTKRRLNDAVKFRERFRPFAPVVMSDFATEWFDLGEDSTASPFMLRVLPVHEHKRPMIPAVTHIDGTARVQTLERGQNPLLYKLIQEFQNLTGVPVLVNTSLNVRGEPIVEQPEDALWLLLGTGVDFCVIHDRVITKKDASKTLLDLTPRVSALEVNLNLDTRSGKISTVLNGEDSVRCRTEHEWGVAEFPLPLRMMSVLSLVDGRRDGHDILRELPHQSQSLLARSLLILRRMGLISLDLQNA